MTPFAPPRLYTAPEFFEVGISVGPLKSCSLCGGIVIDETEGQHREYHKELAVDVKLAAGNKYRSLTTD
ncbi:MAG TPA: hypothetical protein VE091_10645 [Gemmatimonadales bacterium]|nr:hypothetical protein [Gemmatimonadales bacterium]